MVGLFTPVLVLGAYDVEVLRDAGVSSNRLDLVIVGDGSRARDQSKFTDDAQALSQSRSSTRALSSMRADAGQGDGEPDGGSDGLGTVVTATSGGCGRASSPSALTWLALLALTTAVLKSRR